MAQIPECYGVFWEGVASTPQCNAECGAKQECLAKFATGVLVRYQRELGDQATIHDLAKLASVKPEAILLAIDYQNNVVKAQSPQRIPAPTVDVVPVPMPPPVDIPQDDVPVPPPVLESTPELDGGAIPLDESGEVAVAKKPPRQKKAAPQKEAAPKKAPAATTTPASETKVAPRKKAPPKRKAVAVNPPKAGAAKRAAAPARTARGENAIPAEAPAGPRQWNQDHDLARFHRERERNPLIRKLPVGYVLQRTWPYQNGLGPNHRVVVGKRSYRYNGQEYPTLYAVVQAIAGVKEYSKQMRLPGKESSRPAGKKLSTSWSVTKFFGLDKEILSLEEERQGQGKCQPPKWEKHPRKKKKPPKCGKS